MQPDGKYLVVSNVHLVTIGGDILRTAPPPFREGLVWSFFYLNPLSGGGRSAGCTDSAWDKKYNLDLFAVMLDFLKIFEMIL